MEAAESPLDVLSRAATMVQDSSPPDYSELCFSYLFHRDYMLLLLLLLLLLLFEG
jgi:hypothetical protein